MPENYIFNVYMASKQTTWFKNEGKWMWEDTFQKQRELSHTAGGKINLYSCGIKCEEVSPIN